MTARQWRAFLACIIHRRTQREAAKMFGVTQSAISQRLRMVREVIEL